MTHDGAAKIGPLQWPRQWCGCRNAVCGRPGAVYTLELCHPLCAALLTCSSAALASRSRSRDHTQEIASSFPVSFVSFSTSSHFVFCHSPSPFSPPSPSCSRRISTLSCPPPGLWALRPKQIRSPFFSFAFCLQRVSHLRSSHSDVSYGQKQTTFRSTPGERLSLSLFNSARAAVH